MGSAVSWGDEIEFCGVKWTPVEGCKYQVDYYDMWRWIHENPKPQANDDLGTYRHLLETDLFFILHFILKIPGCNHPFVVDACREVGEGPASHTLELWARAHFKSTIFTTAEIIQKICKNRNERIAILSHTKANAKAFLNQLKVLFESNEWLVRLMPDILYANPDKESPKWSNEEGLTVKRDTFARECTLEAHGLIEGMPTGKHFTWIVYDDVETADYVNTPEIMLKLKEAFDMSLSLGTIEGTFHRVVGTTYHHEGLLEYLRNKKDVDGNLIYTVRCKPATVDGRPNGKSVLLPESKLAEERINRYKFYSQYLLDPTPVDAQDLPPDLVREVLNVEIPERLYKFMIIDPAGVRSDKRRGDSWAILCVGVEPYRDDIGASNTYILDARVEPMSESDAMREIVAMYLRSGRVLKVGVEKVALSSAEVHIANALRSKGRILTVENEGLVLLRPGGRSKEERIIRNLHWPLHNGKIHISSQVPAPYRERLKLEMKKFPYWHDDFLDGLSYVYDLIKDYKFPLKDADATPDKWRDALRNRKGKTIDWMSA